MSDQDVVHVSQWATGRPMTVGPFRSLASAEKFMERFAAKFPGVMLDVDALTPPRWARDEWEQWL